ncbi:MAG TPA: glycosyltransferase family 4 protein [Blastocatellia bacterium]|jgi:glycosyltransferase involved in cell wall biosynthesis
MKLTILTQYYPPEVGAPQARLSELAANFVRRGHSVSVLTAMPNYPTGRIHSGYGGLLKRERRDGVDIIRTFVYPTQSAGFVRRLSSYFSFVASSGIFGSFLLKAPDYMMVESPPLFLGLSGIWLSRLKRTRLIFNVSDLWPETAVRLGMLSPESRSFRLSSWLEKLCYEKAWLVTGQSKSILSSISERFPNCPTFHLSNGVDTARFSPEQKTEAGRAALGGDGDFVVLYAGLHGLAQGLDQVIAAAERVGPQSGFRFVLIGDGPEKKMLMEQARAKNLSNVTFLDPRPAREIPQLLASADLVLVPLKSYIPGAVPSKLYEAMASGRPAVLVAEGEAEDIVRNHQAGMVVKPGDIEGLVESLQKLRADSHLRNRMGENGRKAAKEHFDRTSIADRFIDHLEANLYRQRLYVESSAIQPE